MCYVRVHMFTFCCETPLALRCIVTTLVLALFVVCLVNLNTRLYTVARLVGQTVQLKQR